MDMVCSAILHPLMYGNMGLTKVARVVVWVTDRMNQKEDELQELQEHLEKYESLLDALKQGGGGSSAAQQHLVHLCSLAFKGQDFSHCDEAELVEKLSIWITKGDKKIEASEYDDEDFE